jgi:hypothetical protein
MQVSLKDAGFSLCYVGKSFQSLGLEDPSGGLQSSLGSLQVCTT